MNGVRPPDVHPALPVTPDALGRDARLLARQGVSSVHVHPRGPDGDETLESGQVGDAVAAIHVAVPGMQVVVPAGRWVQPDPRVRAEAVLAWGRLGVGAPDVVSVERARARWREVCTTVASVRMGVELGVWTAADAITVRTLGVPPATVRVVVEPTLPGPDAVLEAARILDTLGEPGVPVLLHGEEHSAWPALAYALRRGLDARIGLEDVLLNPDNRPTAGNEELVTTALVLAARRSRPPIDAHVVAMTSSGAIELC